MKGRTVVLTLSFISFMLLFWACGPGSDTSESTAEPAVNVAGRQLVLTQCATCHNQNAAIQDRTAPTMAEVKEHYLEMDRGIEHFKKEVVQFLLAPSEQNSKMPVAVEMYGLMPVMGYSSKQLEDAAEYLYFADLESTEELTLEEQSLLTSNLEASDFMEQGQVYALATKAILGKNLMGQIKQNGTEMALTFCNENAIQLTDSMGQAQEVKIKRVSDQPRNPNNRANESEATYIQIQKKRLAGGEQAQPALIEIDGHVLGYYPIITNAMCLQCHGTVGEAIQPTVHKRIGELYPSDEATGYGNNELRGIWVVEMSE